MWRQYLYNKRETTTVDPIKYIQGRNIKARSTGYKTCNQERYIDLIIPCRTGARHFIQRSTFFEKIYISTHSQKWDMTLSSHWFSPGFFFFIFLFLILDCQTISWTHVFAVRFLGQFWINTQQVRRIIIKQNYERARFLFFCFIWMKN